MSALVVTGPAPRGRLKSVSLEVRAAHGDQAVELLLQILTVTERGPGWCLGSHLVDVDVDHGHPKHSKFDSLEGGGGHFWEDVGTLLGHAVLHWAFGFETSWSATTRGTSNTEMLHVAVGIYHLAYPLDPENTRLYMPTSWLSPQAQAARNSGVSIGSSCLEASWQTYTIYQRVEDLRSHHRGVVVSVLLCIYYIL